MSSTSHRFLTEEEFFLWEEYQPLHKHQFYRGEVFTMEGSTADQATVNVNLCVFFGNLTRSLPSQCYASLLMVRCPSGLFTYPDFIIVEQEPQCYDRKQRVLTNPVWIFEILSSTTEAYDRGVKFEHYQSISTLKHYVILAENRPHIEHYQKVGQSEWRLQSLKGSNVIWELSEFSTSVSIGEFYHKVDYIENEVREALDTCLCDPTEPPNLYG